jgi:hypothetical protein
LLPCVCAAGVAIAVLVGHYIILNTTAAPLPTNRAGAVMCGLVAASILLPVAAITAAALLIKRWAAASKHHHIHKTAANTIGAALPAVVAADLEAGADEVEKAGSAALVAASAAAAEAVRFGLRGTLVSSTSIHNGKETTTLQLQLPAHIGGVCNFGGSSGSSSSSSVISVTAGRPQLQQLMEGWMATMQQLPSSALCGDDDAAGPSGPLGSDGSKRKSKQAITGDSLYWDVYAMGPAPLVADARVICGKLKGVCFSQRTHQL